MDFGSLYGNESYFGPDWGTDYLHRQRGAMRYRIAYFICLFFVRTRSYSSSITLMNDTSLCQKGG